MCCYSGDGGNVVNFGDGSCGKCCRCGAGLDGNDDADVDQCGGCCCCCCGDDDGSGGGVDRRIGCSGGCCSCGGGCDSCGGGDGGEVNYCGSCGGGGDGDVNHCDGVGGGGCFCGYGDCCGGGDGCGVNH